jgi:hypothetical protein
MQDQENLNGEGSDVTTPVDPKPPVTAADIGAELSANEAGKAASEAAQDKPQAAQPQQLDLSQFSPEMLAQLKAALDNVPSAILKPKGNHTVELREFGGKLVVDFKRAFLKAIFDPEMRAERIRQHIELTLLAEDGSKEQKVVLYQDFMAAPRVQCEILKQTTVPKTKKVGQVFHRDNKVMVDQIVTWNEITLTIKDARTGKTFEMNSERVNQ